MYKRFNREGLEKDGYYPIYSNGFTRVHKESPVNSMKNLQGFCVCNGLSSGRIAKLQGGYYILTKELKWELIGYSLNTISFDVLLKKLKDE